MLQWLQQEGVAARLHKEVALLTEGNSAIMVLRAGELEGPVAAAEALVADLLRLGPSPEGHTSHLQYLCSLLTRVSQLPATGAHVTLKGHCH